MFLDSVPSEAVLCSFAIGRMTTTEVLDALGEPTYYSDSTSGATLQYWIGSEAELGTGLVRMVGFGFDAAGALETPWVQEVPLPGAGASKPARSTRMASEGQISTAS